MTVGDFLGLGALIVALVSAGFVFIPAIRKSRTDATVAEVEVDDKIAERRLGEINRLDTRVKALELSDEANRTKLSAFGRIITALADQWPKDAPAPTFDEADLAEVAGDLPAKWRKRITRPRTT